MNQSTTIKVSQPTLKALHRVAGELQMKRGEQVTLEEAITYLINQNDRLKNGAGAQGKKSGQDRSAILALQAQEFVCAGPEDYAEYDFEDIGD